MPYYMHDDMKNAPRLGYGVPEGYIKGWNAAMSFMAAHFEGIRETVEKIEKSTKAIGETLKPPKDT